MPDMNAHIGITLMSQSELRRQRKAQAGRQGQMDTANETPNEIKGINDHIKRDPENASMSKSVEDSSLA